MGGKLDAKGRDLTGLRGVLAALLLAGVVAGTAEAKGCMTMTATAYSREAYGGITANGKSVWSGRYAAVHEWSWLPWGTLVEVEGWGVWQIEDTGDPYGIMPEDWIDLQFDTETEAWAFGRRAVCARVLRLGYGK